MRTRRQCVVDQPGELARLDLLAVATRARCEQRARAGQFYEKYAAGSPVVARERLLGDLADAFEGNAKQITRKRRWLQSATLALVGGLAIAALLIVRNEPTKMKATCAKPRSQHCPAQGSNKSGQAAQSQKTSHTGELLKLAEEIEGGRAHGVIYRIAEVVEDG